MAEAIFSAVVGDVVSRVISLVAGRFKDQPSTEAKLRKICHLLIKIHSVVEEAKGRQITNHGTLEWLSELIDGTYQGRYLLDTIRCGELELQHEHGDKVVAQPFSFSLFNPAKRVRVAASTVKTLLSRQDIGAGEIDKVLESLQSLSGDLTEFLMLLQVCQQIHWPLATNIFVDGQMFGRHVEKERIINFLLHDNGRSTGKLAVLPIVGDIGVGKTTLVQHVYDDARVRDRFPIIMLFNFLCAYPITKSEATVVLRSKHVIGDAENLTEPLHVLKGNFRKKRFLMVFEDVDMRNKQMLEELLPSLRCGKQGSKIIVTTNNRHVASIGTVEPIKLKVLPHPEYWFFFKEHAFAGTDVEEDLRLVAAGKAIARKLNGSFFGAKIVGGMLKPHPNPQFWCKVLRSNIGGLSLLGDGLGYIGDLADNLLPSYVDLHQVTISKNPYSSQTDLARLQDPCLPSPNAAPRGSEICLAGDVDFAKVKVLLTDLVRLQDLCLPSPNAAPRGSEICLADDVDFAKVKVLLCKSVFPFYCVHYTAHCTIDLAKCCSKLTVA